MLNGGIIAYTIKIAATLTQTLASIVTLNPHQLAGHVANLDFWLAEVRHCIAVIDGYRKRFEARKASEVNYVAEKRTTKFPYRCEGFCEVCAQGESASPPKGIPDAELREALRMLRDAAYRLLVRCYTIGFIDEVRFRQAGDSVGTGIDVSDLKR